MLSPGITGLLNGTSDGPRRPRFCDPGCSRRSARRLRAGHAERSRSGGFTEAGFRKVRRTRSARDIIQPSHNLLPDMTLRPQPSLRGE